MPKARRSRPGLVITTTNIIITTITAMGMRMAESALYDLLSWMSPSYPIGAFAHSSGLEWAVEAGHANDRMSAQGWIDAMIVHGAIRVDAILFVHAHRAACDGDAARFAEVAELAAATLISRERRIDDRKSTLLNSSHSCASRLPSLFL